MEQENGARKWSNMTILERLWESENFGILLVTLVYVVTPYYITKFSLYVLSKFTDAVYLEPKNIQEMFCFVLIGWLIVVSITFALDVVSDVLEIVSDVLDNSKDE
jgi:hypothetical protein